MLRFGGWSRATVAALALVVTLTAASCLNPDDRATDVTPDEFTSAMQDRFGIGEQRATCITEYVFEDYGADEITVLVDQGLPALPQARWEPYLNSSAACITHDEPLPGSP